MLCLGVKYAHGTIISYLRSSAKNSCYIVYVYRNQQVCLCVCLYLCKAVRYFSSVSTCNTAGLWFRVSRVTLWDAEGGFCALLIWSLFSFLFCFFLRVINAGKSTHNEDQASCEVLFVKKKAGGSNSTPNKNSTKRRSSLPNGEGLQLKDNSVSKILYLVSGEIQNNIKGYKNVALKGVFWLFRIFSVTFY